MIARPDPQAYYPYGETFTNTGTADVAYKYTGKERDGSTGLYFYEARYYDGALGRFISADTIVPDPLNPQALNRYAYAANNPILYNDPSGHCPWCIPVGFAIGAIVGGVVSGIQSDWDIYATTTGALFGGFSGAVGGAVGPAVGSFYAGYYGAIGTGIGLAAGGAAAGGTNALFYRMSGYDTNIGLAIAAGAAGGLISGGFIGIGSHLGGDGLGAIVGAFAGKIASAPAAGAVNAAISGNDPGQGALLALRDAGLSIGATFIIALTRIDSSGLGLSKFAPDGRVEVSSPSSGRPFNSTAGMTGSLQPERHVPGALNISLNLAVALTLTAEDVAAANSIIDGAGLISTAAFIMYGGPGPNGIPSPDSLIARQLGLNLSPANRLLLQGARLSIRIPAVGLTLAGSAMIGTGIYHFAPKRE